MRTIRGLLALTLTLTALVGASPIAQASPVFDSEAAAITASGDVVPLTPDRILDTRSGNGVAQAGTVGPAGSIDVVVLGRGGVPNSGVDAVVVNVTAARQSVRTFITVWPTGDPLPVASSLNADPGRPVSNLVVAKVGANGSISLFNGAGTVHLIGDVVGWLPSGSRVVATPPERLLDTRVGLGTTSAARLGPGEQLDLTVSGVGSVPSIGVDAAIVNVTAVGPTQATFITAFPRGEPRPLTATVNPAVGGNVATLAVVKLDTGGAFTLYNDSGTAHLIVDVLGYTRTSADLASLVPSRILDTRTGVGAPLGPVGPGGEIDVVVTGVGGVPAGNVDAVWLNLGAAGSTAGSFVTTWPSGESRPLASVLNTNPARAVSNLVLAPVGADGSVSLYNDVGTVHLIADVVAYVSSGERSPFTITQRFMEANARSTARETREEYDRSADEAGDPDGGETETVTERYSRMFDSIEGTIGEGDSVQSFVLDDAGDDEPPPIHVGEFDPATRRADAASIASAPGARADAGVGVDFDVAETATQMNLDVRVDAATTVTTSPDTQTEFPNGDELTVEHDAFARAQGRAVIWFDVPTPARLALSSDCFDPDAGTPDIDATGFTQLTRFVGNTSVAVWDSRQCESVTRLEAGTYRLEASGQTSVGDNTPVQSNAISIVLSITLTAL